MQVVGKIPTDTHESEIRECENWHLSNIWQVFSPGGSLQKAGGDGWGAFLDQLSETGGAMSGSQIGRLAFLPQCQVELLSSPAGEKGGRQTTKAGVLTQ